MIEQVNTIAQIWWNWMWPMFWQVSVLVVFLGAIDFLLRRHIWPQVRYALWLLILIKLILPPTFSLSTSIISQARIKADQMATQLTASNGQAEFPSIGLSSELNAYITDIGIEPIPKPEAIMTNVTNEPLVKTHSSDIAGSGINVKIHWHAYAMAVWLIVLVALSLWVVIKFRKLRKFHAGKDSITDLPQWFGPLLAQTAKKLGLRKLPEIASSRNISSPAVFGTFRPVLVLPAATLHRLSQKRTEHILLHELAHIKRGDLLVNAFYMLLQIVYWFNPLLWLLRRRLQHLRELCCDATVAGILRDKTMDYRETILQNAKWLLAGPARSGIGLLGLAEDSHNLLVRLNWLEKKTWKYRGLRIVTVCAVVALMVSGVLPMAKAKKGEATITSEEIEVAERVSSQPEHKHGLELAGRVLTEDGQPVAGATVCLGNTYVTDSDDRHRNWESLSWQGGLFHPANLQSKSDGHFLFNFLSSGKTDVWAEHPQWGWAWMRDIKTDAKDIELRLRRQPQKIRLSGKVLNADREPAEDVRILIYEKGDDSLVVQTKSDVKGQFKIDVDPPWTWCRQLELLCVPMSGPPAWRIMPYCSAQNLHIQLKQGTKITGRVVNSKGEGVANANVKFDYVKDRDYGITWFPDEMAEVAPSANTDAKGNFTIKQVPLGSSVTLRAEHPDYGSERTSDIVASGEGIRIGDIQLPDGVTVEGTVRFTGTDEVARGIKVRVVRSSKTLSQTTTDSNGRYRLWGIGLPGFYEILNIRAEDSEETPEWEGQATIEKELKPGDRLSDVDIYLERPLAFRQKSWRTRRGKVVEGYQVAILNDNDPAYKGKEEYEDTVALYGSGGEQQWQIKGLNTCQTIGANHAIVYNPYDKTIWCVEKVGKRLIKIDLNGNVLFEIKDINPNSLAVDPKTGNVWVLTSEGTIYGKNLIVLNPSGQKIHDWDHKGFDIAYSEKDDCFWLVGKTVLKLNKNGEAIFKWSEEFAWVAVSVGINNSDGSAWVIERRHSQVKDSQNRVWVFESGGKVHRKIDLKDRGVSSVAVDSQHGFAWVPTSQGALKLALDGDIKADIPIQGFSVCIDPDSGHIWVSGRKGLLYRLNRNGDLVWSKEIKGGSQKWLCVIPN